jgi:hypothetical protein
MSGRGRMGRDMVSRLIWMDWGGIDEQAQARYNAAEKK